MVQQRVKAAVFTIFHDKGDTGFQDYALQLNNVIGMRESRKQE